MVNEQEADPWTWHLTESSPRGQAGELLLLSEAKQGCSSGKTEAAAARLGAGDEDPGEDDVLQRGLLAGNGLRRRSSAQAQEDDAGEQRRVLHPARTKQRRGRGLQRREIRRR